MTVRAHRDWKVTTGYRVLVRIGWTAFIVAVSFAAVAAALDSIGGWWVVAGLALAVLVLTAVLPEPVPHDLITGPHTMVDPLQRR